ncbi:ATP-dependent Clp protease proteolytic subunit [Candidatus Microgenomates bacterium]|nr:ATP-dependent Clp protease proteolytic subunit [Candidatus Microgenomates bacterium]
MIEKSLKDAKNIYYIHLVGEIEETRVAKTVEELDIGNAKEYVDEIRLTLVSYGGDLLYGMALYQHIKSSKKPVTIVTEGVCMSVAVTILQAANLRVSRPQCVFMVHPSITTLEERSYPEFISMVEQFKKTHDVFVDLTIKRSGMEKNEFESIYNPRKYLTPQEALEFGKFGLIDEIREN